jgi:hypothetical protein
MIYLLKKTWTYFSTGTDDNGDPGEAIYDVLYYEFDSSTRTVAAYNPQLPSAAAPVDYSRDTAEEFYVYVNGATCTGYFHDGNGGVTTVVTTLVVTPQVKTVACYGANTGDILLVPSGLTGAFTYQWDDGPTTAHRSAVRAGTYRALVTHTASGARLPVVVQVGTNPELQVTVQAIGPKSRCR